MRTQLLHFCLTVFFACIACDVLVSRQDLNDEMMSFGYAGSAVIGGLLAFSLAMKPESKP